MYHSGNPLDHITDLGITYFGDWGICGYCLGFAEWIDGDSTACFIRNSVAIRFSIEDIIQLLMRF